MDKRIRDLLDASERADSWAQIILTCLLFWSVMFGGMWIGLERSSVTNPQGVGSNE